MTTSAIHPPRKFDATEVLRWWASLRPDPETGRPGDPGALAELRRCSTSAHVHLVPVFETLVRALPDARIDDLAVIAACVAHVREHDGAARVAEQIARTPPGAGLPPVSPLRFRRLLQVSGREERLSAGVRLVRQLKGTVNVVDLASSLYWWDVEDEVQRRWARAYYASLPTDLLKRN